METDIGHMAPAEAISLIVELLSDFDDRNPGLYGEIAKICAAVGNDPNGFGEARAAAASALDASPPTPVTHGTPTALEQAAEAIRGLLRKGKL